MPKAPVEALSPPAEDPETASPAYALEGSFPNPFNPSTTIRFDIPESVQVRLVVFDVMGREVARLVDGTIEAGMHEVSFDASHLPSGMYFAHFTAGGFTQTQRMTLLK